MSSLGLGQCPLLTGGIEAREHCSLGCWVGTRLRLGWWKTPDPGDAGQGRSLLQQLHAERAGFE